MCFSATASFVASAALIATGSVTLKKAKKRDRALAALPILFGIQQFIDGIAWISIGTPLLNGLAAYGFALFAYALWPVYIPFAVLRTEKDAEHRRVMRILLGVGALVSIFALTNMLSGPVSAHIEQSCIQYDLPLAYPLSVLWLYLLATCGSLIISSQRFIRLFGILVLVSSAIAGWVYTEIFASVWCFFAAVLSGLLYLHFNTRPRRS